eukprot:TRINITY_DN4249_c0_g4_i1.p1 TRINITY_DN4249_c0_g4~~TRINITY_DN4249_c0_g4_i1.p1  ORF type:complete len:318 (+),score=86.21 TRINITY_DN4249_c0_g4_i1:462-1415(+)
MSYNHLKLILLVVILMGTSNYPSYNNTKIDLKIAAFEEAMKVDQFWEKIQEEKQEQHNAEIERLIFEISLVQANNQFLRQSNTLLHSQIAGLEQTIQLQDSELRNKEKKIASLQNSTKTPSVSSTSSSSPSKNSTTSTSTYTSQSSSSSSSSSTTSHLKDAINTIGTFVLGLGESIQEIWSEVTTMVTSPIVTPTPQSKYIHHTPADKSFSYQHVRSCVVNYTMSSGGFVDENSTDNFIDRTTMDVVHAFTDATIKKRRPTTLLITGNNKTNINTLWDCLSGMKNYGRQFRISSSMSQEMNLQMKSSKKYQTPKRTK